MNQAETLDEYQRWTATTVTYPERYEHTSLDGCPPLEATRGLLYVALQLGSEAGEVQGKISKILRDQDGQIRPENLAALRDELGDVLWNLARTATELGLSLQEVADRNREKIHDRMRRGTLAGSGDQR